MLFPETNHSLWNRSLTALFGLTGIRCMSLSFEGEGLKLWSGTLIRDPSGLFSQRLCRVFSELLGKTKSRRHFMTWRTKIVSRDGEDGTCPSVLVPSHRCPWQHLILPVSTSPLLFLPLISIFSLYTILLFLWADRQRATNYHHYMMHDWTKWRFEAL